MSNNGIIEINPLQEFYDEVDKHVPGDEMRIRLGEGGAVLIGFTLFFFSQMWQESDNYSGHTRKLSPSIKAIEICGSSVDICNALQSFKRIDQHETRQ